MPATRLTASLTANPSANDSPRPQRALRRRLVGGMGWVALGFACLTLPVASSPAVAVFEAAAAQEKVTPRPPLDRPDRPSGEAETQWRLVGSEEQPGSALDQDPVFQLHRLLARWSDAWANKRTDDYLSFYSRDFRSSDFATREEWAALRRQRLARPRVIRIEISSVVVAFESQERAALRFRQAYQADDYSDLVDKTLVAVLEQGDWKIVSETSEPVPR